MGVGDKALRRRRDPTRWKAWRRRVLSQARTWREQKNCEEEKHTGARRCAMGFHDIEQRQVSIQRQSPESTDRSPLVSVARFGQWQDPGQQTPGFARQSTKARQRGDGPPFE